jgi:DNA polymerase elongation subunit (family B)
VTIPDFEIDFRDAKVLDFDIEALAAGYADPAWVPDKITCIAWSFVGSDKVESVISDKEGFFSRKRRAEMLKPFLAAAAEADVLTGHNIVRYDLPVIQAECMRVGIDPIGPFRVQDTIRMRKTKGFKKGQDNIGRLLDSLQQKEAMDWEAWDQAYEEDGWAKVVSRCKTDVIQHKQIREEMIARGWLRGTTTWRG